MRSHSGLRYARYIDTAKHHAYYHGRSNGYISRKCFHGSCYAGSNTSSVLSNLRRNNIGRETKFSPPLPAHLLNVPKGEMGPLIAKASCRLCFLLRLLRDQSCWVGLRRPKRGRRCLRRYAARDIQWTIERWNPG